MHNNAVGVAEARRKDLHAVRTIARDGIAIGGCIVSNDAIEIGKIRSTCDGMGKVWGEQVYFNG
jgi:hypothetical protein